ncbi:hypothetical protein pdul_cds_804 [Pandoravirus dulcis]|uniref:Uncharacterized protein n=1 Tax=Pandoravirus dulcis TaxID=1349409 RepID=A0A291AU59_9VIRU|nr:hypothetical protein pdul_cds_804 [Pandoravirus dulcis]ATE82550.1 hypothetical protein pdul_cds_804 [Pandoravirus dulcis]
MDDRILDNRHDRPSRARSIVAALRRRLGGRACPVDGEAEQMAALCRRLGKSMAKGERALALAFCAVGCAKVLLVEPGDVDALHPWHLYVGPRRPALIHVTGFVHSTYAALEEDGAAYLVVAGETNRDERFRVILSMSTNTMTAKIYRAPRRRPFGPPITCAVRVHPTPR